MVTGYQNGTIAQLLQAIIGQINFDGEPISNIGEILLSILEQTPYDDEPKSVLAELFLKLKAKLENEPFEPYDKEPTSAIAEILLSILNVTPYEKEPNSRIAELLLELKAELESYVILTASGAIANFTTSLALPLVSIKASIVATESGSGTKSPSNPYTLGGFSNAVITKSGANLFDEVMELGVLDNNGNIQSSTSNLVSTNKFAVKGGATLYFSCVKKTSTNQRYGVAFYDKDQNFISGSNSIIQTNTFTTPSNACYMRFFVPLSWYVSSTYENDISINGNSTDTAYHPYTTATQTTLALGQTVYGGEIVLTKKASGYGVKLRVTHKYQDLGDVAYFSKNANNIFYWDDEDIYRGGYDKVILCEIYDYYNKAYGNMPDNSIAHWSTNSKRIAIRDDSKASMTTEEFKAAMSGVHVCYELATPIEIDLSDASDIVALVGVNNVWSDTGDVEVEYYANISDNLEQTSKSRAIMKAEKELKEKQEKELKEIVKEPIIEPIKDEGELKK